MMIRNIRNTIRGIRVVNQRGMSGFADMLRQTVAKNKEALNSKTDGTSSTSENTSKEPIINSQDELQPEWAALERRVLERKSMKIGEKPQGRTALRQGSAWDAENI